MKKIFKKVLLCTITLATLFVLTGCTKVALTAEQYKDKMEKLDFDVEDVTSQYKYSNMVKTGYVAIKAGKIFQIEFYELRTESDAVSMYNTNKQKFENEKGSSSINTNVEGKNYSKYTLTTGGKYKVVCRVENTLIYLNVDDEYKNEVKQVLDSLGY